MSKVKIERIDVLPESLFFQEHLARYQFALDYLQPGMTLDIACGTGYGTQRLLAQNGGHVVGVDLDWSALLQSRRDYPDARNLFIAANGIHLPFADRRFRNIVSFETIEHIQDDTAFLCELARTLRSDGTCILSTPNRSYSEREKRANPYHVREYVESDLLAVLRTAFSRVTLFYQGFSQDYHDTVSQYTSEIQTRKRQLNPIVQFGINQIYHPLKRLFPARVTNLLIRQILGLGYPQPANSQIVISQQPLLDTSVFVAVCRL